MQQVPFHTRQASDLWSNGYSMLSGRPCKIAHVYARDEPDKIQVVGVDVFTGETLRDEFPSTGTVQVPHVYSIEYFVVCKPCQYYTYGNGNAMIREMATDQLLA